MAGPLHTVADLLVLVTTGRVNNLPEPRSSSYSYVPASWSPATDMPTSRAAFSSSPEASALRTRSMSPSADSIVTPSDLTHSMPVVNGRHHGRRQPHSPAAMQSRGRTVTVCSRVCSSFTPPL